MRLRNLLTLGTIVGAVIVGGILSLYAQRKLQEEQAVYVALFSKHQTKILPNWNNVAYVSAPAICKQPEGISENHDLANLFEAYLGANDNTTQTVSFAQLEGIVPVVSEQSARKIYRAGGIQWLSDDNIRFIGLSRAGFSLEIDEAMVCIHFAGGRHGGADLLRFVKRNGEWDVLENWYTYTSQ